MALRNPSVFPVTSRFGAAEITARRVLGEFGEFFVSPQWYLGWCGTFCSRVRPGCAATRLCDDPAVRRHGCAATRLCGDTVVRQPGSSNKKGLSEKLGAAQAGGRLRRALRHRTGRVRRNGGERIAPVK